MVGGSSSDSVTTVTASAVTVTRSIEQRNGMVAGQFTLESEREQPVLVTVVDRIPETVPVDVARFKPGAEPDMGEIGPDEIEIKQRVGDDVVDIPFGIILEESIEDIQWASPDVRTVRTIEARSDGSQRPTDGSTTDATPPERDGDRDAVIYRGASVGASVDRGDDRDRTAASDDPSHEADHEQTGSGSFARRLSEGELAAAALLENLEDHVEEPGNERQTTADEANADTTSAAEADADAESNPDPGTDSDAAANTVLSTDRELSDPAGTRDRDDRRSGSVPRSLELRLDRLSARVEEFATYATTLEAIIDGYGTGDEIVADLDGRLESVEAKLETVEGDLTAIREERNRSLADVEETLDRIQTRVDSVESDVLTLSERHDEEMARVDGRIDALEETVQTLSETVESMDETIGSLDEEVESLHAFRRSLADIFHQPEQ